METAFLKEALFTGHTGNAFKLGTALTQGWFWFRPEGCSLLFRGLNMFEIDFYDILFCANIDVTTITVPSYLSHNSSTNYFYVLRKVNCCGELEYTLSASAKAGFDGNGNLAIIGPNSIFAVFVQQLTNTKIRLIWFYCPLKEKQKPAKFKIYYDNATGQVDYQNALATINYAGRRFYQYLSNQLQANDYLFVIRVEDSFGNQDASLAKFKISLGNNQVEPVTVLDITNV